MSSIADNAASAPSEPTAPAAGSRSAVRPFYWSVRRELWEHRSIHMAPLIAASVVMAGLLISAIRLGHHLSDMPHFDPTRDGGALAVPFGFAAIPIIVTAQIVAVFYCLGALNNERRDRSILFWKSLPVSDLVSVLAKAVVPLAALPLVTLATVLALHAAMLLLGTVTLLAHGLDPSPFWTGVPWLQVEVTLVYLLIVTSLWYAPIYGWLFLVSAWARRAPFLWAVLPPLALMLLERIALDTSNFGALVSYRFHGGFAAAFDGDFQRPMGRLAHDAGMHVDLPRMDPVQFFTTPGLWAGLVFAAAFLAAAAWLRRYREPT